MALTRGHRELKVTYNRWLRFLLVDYTELKKDRALGSLVSLSLSYYISVCVCVCVCG